MELLQKVQRYIKRAMKTEKEEVEYIEKEEILNSIREGLREIKEARRTGRKLMTAEELLNEL
jgi:urease gamma subunit